MTKAPQHISFVLINCFCIHSIRHLSPIHSWLSPCFNTHCIQLAFMFLWCTQYNKMGRSMLLYTAILIFVDKYSFLTSGYIPLSTCQIAFKFHIPISGETEILQNIIIISRSDKVSSVNRKALQSTYVLYMYCICTFIGKPCFARRVVVYFCSFLHGW